MSKTDVYMMKKSNIFGFNLIMVTVDKKQNTDYLIHWIFRVQPKDYLKKNKCSWKNWFSNVKQATTLSDMFNVTESAQRVIFSFLVALTYSQGDKLDGGYPGMCPGTQTLRHNAQLSPDTSNHPFFTFYFVYYSTFLLWRQKFVCFPVIKMVQHWFQTDSHY